MAAKERDRTGGRKKLRDVLDSLHGGPAPRPEEETGPAPAAAPEPLPDPLAAIRDEISALRKRIEGMLDEPRIKAAPEPQESTAPIEAPGASSRIRMPDEDLREALQGRTDAILEELRRAVGRILLEIGRSSDASLRSINEAQRRFAKDATRGFWAQKARYDAVVRRLESRLESVEHELDSRGSRRPPA